MTRAGLAIIMTMCIAMAPGAEDVRITSDAMTISEGYALPVGTVETFSVPVSPNDAVSWSLASDGAAEIQGAADKHQVTIAARRTGAAALYVTLSDGRSAMTELEVLDRRGMRQHRAMSDRVHVDWPREGNRILFQRGAHGVPVTLLARSDTSDDAGNLRMRIGDYETVVPRRSRTAFTYPDITVLPSWTSHAVQVTTTSLYQADEVYSSPKTFHVAQVDADSNGGGFPDDPFALGLATGDLWRASSPVSGDESVVREISIAGLDGPASRSGQSEAITVALQDPERPERLVTVAVPEGLLEFGESAVVTVVAADTFDAVPAAGSDLPPLPDYVPVSHGWYLFVEILVSRDGGLTFRSIDAERVEAKPVVITMEGLDAIPDDNKRFLTMPAGVQDRGRIDRVDAEVMIQSRDWHSAPGGNAVEKGRIETLYRGGMILAPFHTPGYVHITDIEGTSGYATGGQPIRITMRNAPPADRLTVALDGEPVRIAGFEDGDYATVTVIAPRARTLRQPAPSHSVDVTAWDKESYLNADTVPGGFTYLGPRVIAIEPESGTEAGGDTIAILGEGFDGQGMTAMLDDRPLIGIHRVTHRGLHGITPSGRLGDVSIEVRTANGYLGRRTEAYKYIPATPVLTRMPFDTALSDGGYRIRLSGAFLNALPGKLSDTVMAYFALDPDHPQPDSDIPAAKTIVRDNGTVDIITPAAPGAMASAVYLVRDADQPPSNVKPFSFVDGETTGMVLTDVRPYEGSIGGGESALIEGNGLLSESGSLPRVYFGNRLAPVESAGSSGNGEYDALRVIVPPGERAESVDVRVQDEHDGSRLTVMAGAYTYQSDGAPLIEHVEPGEAYVFGGVVARITGSGFVPEGRARSRVYIGGVEAPLAPVSDGYYSTDEALYVVVPTLDDTVEPNADELVADVLVVNPDGKRYEWPETFTYVRRAERMESVNAAGRAAPVQSAVYTNAFAFHAEDGVHDRTVWLGPVSPPATIHIPPLPDVTGEVFAVVRATRNPTAFGLDRVDEGIPWDGIWTVSLHLYQGDYPFEELDVTFALDVPIVMDLPVGSLPDKPVVRIGDIRDGGVTLYRAEAMYDYADTSPKALWKTNAPERYQWNVGPMDTYPLAGRNVSDDTPVRRIRVRMDGPGVAGLRRDAYLTKTVVDSTHYRVSENVATRGSYKGGDEVIIRGRGLAWPTRILFGDVVAYERDADLENRLIFASDTELRVLSPAFDGEDGETVVDITVEMPQRSNATMTIHMPKQFTFENPTWLTQLLTALIGIPIALIGLLAGGRSAGSGGGPCFIATAAYGTSLAEQVEVLRTFRDIWLLDNAVGTAFVDIYYRLSPTLADIIAGHPALAAMVRLALWPVVLSARFFAAVPGIGHMTVMVLLGISFLRIRRKSTQQQ